MENHKCDNCQKNFSKSEIYQVGKERKFFCENCKKGIKNCSSCEKEIASEWRGKFMNGGKRWGDDYVEKDYNQFCDEKCRDEFRNFKNNLPEAVEQRQKQQELKDKDWKPCEREGVFSFLAGLEKCETLIPPTENYCERCKKERIKEQERQKEWDKKNPEQVQINQQKCQQAQVWWSSLNTEQKRAELEKVKVEWVKKMGDDDFESFVEGHGSLVGFKDGHLHCSPTDLSIIPVVFLEKFGIEIYPRNKFFPDNKIFPGYNLTLDQKVKDKEAELEKAKKENRKSEMDRLEREIKDLKQQRNNFSPEKPPKAMVEVKPNTSNWPWIIGIGVVILIIAGLWMVKRSKKK